MITDNLDADAALDRVWMFLTKFSQPLKLMNKEILDWHLFLFQCAKDMKIDPEPISLCASSENGSSLLKKYGDDTHVVNPTFIPTILLNGSKDNQAAILKNFLLEVCKLIDMPLPPPCLWQDRFNRANLHQILNAE